jgi:regulator of sigma E protease
MHMDFLSSGFNIFLIILGFGILIFIHELGHFIAAKWAGIRTEAFAVGMGPVMVAWRKGIGFRFGSTAKDYENRVRLALGQHASAASAKTKSGDGEAESAGLPQAEMYRIGDQLGLGETEYSLRWLPIGGFVKMLGQEDANPNYVSNDPRSYTLCPVGKRMIVVSAGVVMNLILAIILFIVAFMIGVKFEGPVVGDVSQSLPAGRTKADNAAALGITTAGLQPGDWVTAIDGEPAETFADLQIASAMSKPGVPVKLTVRRAGYVEPLRFTLMPEKDATTGLLSIGVAPGSSTTLLKVKDAPFIKLLDDAGLAKQGVKPGMRLARVNGVDVQTYEQFDQQVDQSNGKPIVTEWVMEDQPGTNTATAPVQATLEVEPQLQLLRYPNPSTDKDSRNAEFGLLGLVPLASVRQVLDGPNKGILEEGDVVLRVGDLEGPRIGDFMREVNRQPDSEIEIAVLRDGAERIVKAKTNRKGKLNVALTEAIELPITAEPFDEVRAPSESGTEMIAKKTPIADFELFPRTRIEAIGGVAITDWAHMRQELLRQTESAKLAGKGAMVRMTTTLPTFGAPPEVLEIELNAEQVRSLHDLKWETKLPGYVFEPIYITRTADGSPVKAVKMGFEETKKLVVMTYLTIDRLFRRSVGVDQLRGPVGIVHIGSKVADRGFTYLIFFLAMISVNLAVINFLPMPIVDGGLFLFLIYEKFKGRPPSIAFQNAATMVGLFIIGTLFLVTFYNDVLRLIG